MEIGIGNGWKMCYISLCYFVSHVLYPHMMLKGPGHCGGAAASMCLMMEMSFGEDIAAYCRRIYDDLLVIQSAPICRG
ncbi:hypothetical protein V6N11_077453 [Hibiscus sabdariffa]|uniref:Uncharacterized protein n=1 Tax=Hibiscus sabdariffa TaxID=183260 RepID=A0ABR2TD46_9ROSI